MRTARTRTALGSLAAAAVLALSACGGGSGGDSKGGSDTAKEDSSASESPDAGDESPDASGEPAGPDLEGIPDVVAEVNGEEVTKEEFVPIYEATFQQAAAQAQMGGPAPDEDALKQQALDGLVDSELLAQEADARGLEVADEEVEAELTSLAEQNGMKTGEELLAAIAKQGVAEEVARSQVETQLLVEQLAADEGGPFEPTEKDLRALYDQAKAQAAQSGQQGQKIPPFAEVRDQLEEQARSQETGKIAEQLLQGLREDAEITPHL